MEPVSFSQSTKPRKDSYICTMSVIQCILIDDEPRAITALAYEIQRIQQPKIGLLASFTKARDALNYLSLSSGRDVDVVFLDIEMPDLDGLTFLEAFPHRNFDVIFTTAHSHYAIEAIRKNAFDYLVKPVCQDDLRFALERLAEHRDNIGNNEQSASHLSKAQQFAESGSCVRFEVDRKILFVEPNDIIYCEADGNYCHVFLEEGKTLFLTRQLKEVGIVLPQQQFLRTHRSYIVNLNKIKEYHRVEHYLLLSNGKYLPVSRSMQGFFMKHFGS